MRRRMLFGIPIMRRIEVEVLDEAVVNGVRYRLIRTPRGAKQIWKKPIGRTYPYWRFVCADTSPEIPVERVFARIKMGGRGK